MSKRSKRFAALQSKVDRLRHTQRLKRSVWSKMTNAGFNKVSTLRFVLVLIDMPIKWCVARVAFLTEQAKASKFSSSQKARGATGK